MGLEPQPLLRGIVAVSERGNNWYCNGLHHPVTESRHPSNKRKICMGISLTLISHLIYGLYHVQYADDVMRLFTYLSLLESTAQYRSEEV
jgi:hypothetical protein